MTGPTPAGEPTDTRRVIRLPRATRLLATLLAAWLVCAAVALVVVWFTPLNLEHGRQVSCSGFRVIEAPGPCPVPSPTPCAAGMALVAGSCYFPPYRAVQPARPARVIDAQRAALPILVLRAAALGTAFWVAYLGVRVVLSRVRFTVG
jgi:hypothetical protein